MNNFKLILLLSVVFFAQGNLTQGAEENMDLLQLFVRNQYDSNLNKQEKIQLAKYLIVNGDLDRAKYHLNTLYDLGKAGELIKMRYLAHIAFIEDDMEGVLAQSTQDFQYYPQICNLRILAYLIKGDIKQTKQEFIDCKIRTDYYNTDDYFWLGNLIKTRQSILLAEKQTSDSKARSHKQILSSSEYGELLTYVDSVNKALLWIKLGLYLGLHNDIIRLLQSLPEDLFESIRFQEIMALIYFRNNDHTTARKFIEDVDTANAHNILAGIYLKQNKNELAFAEYKLALLKKHNSRNALEKIIPLSYLLNDYDLGLQSVGLMEHTGLDKKTLAILKSLFLLKKKDYKKAWEALGIFDLVNSTHIPDKVFQMKNYLSIILDYPDEVEKYSNYACLQFDPQACWVKTQLLIWPEFSKHFKRKLDTPLKPVFTSSLLKETWDVSNIKEDLIIDQENLDQLDINQGVTDEIAKNIF